MVPEPASINAILREHCRTRLYVHPIAWTTDQPRLLGCQFVRKALPQDPTETDGAVSATLETNTTEQQAPGVQLERRRLADRIRRFGLGDFMTDWFADLLETFKICTLR
jgi:hypothetical protein